MFDALKLERFWLIVSVLLTVAYFSLDTRHWRLDVVATAYNSVVAQTDDTPNIGAWGDYLHDYTNVIAVSRDLLDLGLGRGSEVYLGDNPEPFVVLDKMAPRWDKRVDIFMGHDIDSAKEFGRQELQLYWRD